MDSFEYEFTFDSFRVGELWGLDHAVKVTVNVEYTVYMDRAYDSPFGALGKGPSVGNTRTTSLWADNHDLISLRESDEQFATEVILEITKQEPRMIERANP
jgi:hypothetical protein